MNSGSWLATIATVCLVVGCAATPSEPVSERVDERTAVTVVTLPRPLLYSGPRGAAGQPVDLSVGPVEVNEMGRRTWFVWVAAAGLDLGVGEPRLLLRVGETLVDLAPLPVEFAPPLSAPAYAKPVAWATERWYAIARDELARLGGSAVPAPALVTGDATVSFEPWEAAPDAWSGFVARQLRAGAGPR